MCARRSFFTLFPIEGRQPHFEQTRGIGRLQEKEKIFPMSRRSVSGGALLDVLGKYCLLLSLSFLSSCEKTPLILKYIFIIMKPVTLMLIFLSAVQVPDELHILTKKTLTIRFVCQN